MSHLLRHRGPDDEGIALLDPRGGRALTLAGPDTPEDVIQSPFPYAPGRFESRDGNGGGSPLDVAFSVGLVTRRLAIVDLSPAGHGPMCDGSRELWITYNGEVYNYVELRAELQALGERFTSGTDTEVVLAAYRRWGTDCLSRFNGMFAFALWDGKRRELFCARDRLGVKPLYYSWEGGRFAFASEPKALVLTQPQPIRVRTDAVIDFIALDWVDHETGTFFEDVHQLPPGHAMIVGENGLKWWAWWTLDPNAHATGTMDAWAEEYASLFTDAVRLRLRADVEVGSCLSGGIDSSSVVCTAAPLLDHPMHAFTCAYDEGAAYDERAFVRAVIEKSGAISHVVVPDGGDFWPVFDRITEVQDEPTAGSGLYSQWKVMELAHRAGLKVLLDGQGGDETLAGYGRYLPTRLRDLIAQGRFGEFARDWGTVASRLGASTALAHTFEPWLPAGLIAPLRRQFGQGKDRVLSSMVRGRAAARAAAVPRPSRDFSSGLANHLAFDVQRRMLPSLLRYEDRNSMAFSIETRLPFLDYRLVEFAFSLPDEAKLDGTTSKAILRRSVADRVPRAVIDRRDKMGFETPSDVWLRGRGAGELRRRLLGPGSLHEWLDPQALTIELEDYVAGRRPTGPQVWRWLSLESWLRSYVTNPTRSFRPAPVVFRERHRQSAFDQVRAPEWEAAPGAASR
jgi:asparagine synthase (glutamine-hydrolysing)